MMKARGIPQRVRIRTSKGNVKIDAEACFSGGVIVHRSFGACKGWTVTHAPTGLAAWREIPTKRLARILAAIFAALFPWDEIKSSPAIFNRKFYALPEAIQHWMMLLRS